VAGCGFGAPAAVASAAAAAAAGGDGDSQLELSAALDGGLAQCLRHLGKRDTTTKMKALQVRQARACVRVCGEPDGRT
jgi:hypothetical protein